MEVLEDHWLSAIFGYPVFRINVEAIPILPAHERSHVFNQIRSHFSSHVRAMYYAKVGTTDIDILRELCLLGLYVVDVNLIFNMETYHDLHFPKFRKISIHKVSPQQHQEVLSIAATCFKYSRFHLDPLITGKIANKIKHDWILSYIRNERGDRLFVAFIDDVPVGFLAALISEISGKRVGIIDLIGVDQTMQHQGIGQTLIAHFMAEYRNKCDYFQVGTQMVNLPSIQLYQKVGFRIVKSMYVMHKHVVE